MQSGMHTCGWCSVAPPVNVLHSALGCEPCSCVLTGRRAPCALGAHAFSHAHVVMCAAELCARARWSLR
eukprot:5301704-Prymnesium_polylepis.1